MQDLRDPPPTRTSSTGPAPSRALARRVAGRATRAALGALGRTRFGSLTHVRTTRNVVAVTFDGGPDSAWTPRVLDVLARHDAKATFFLIGKYVVKHPEIVRRMADEGHALGNHTWDHPSLPLVPSAERRDQVRRCAAALAPYAPDARLFRPPYCEQSLASRWDLFVQGYEVVMAGVTAKDWEDRSEAFMAERLREGIAPGRIVLLHDAVCDQRYRSREAMLAALDGFLAEQTRTYAFVTVPELLRAGKPVRDIWLRPPDVERFAGYERVI